ncbi:MAG: phosphotransferase [Deltaproteobacteria bacterium]
MSLTQEEKRRRPLDELSAIDHLRERGLLGATEQATLEPAGDGNINWVRRVRCADGRSFILKQAREQLERFPEYRVDTKRILIESAWLELARPLDVDGCCPQVLDFCAEARVLVLEDLGEVPRLDDELGRETDLNPALAKIGALLGRVHNVTRGDGSLHTRFANQEMRELHFTHIFDLPFAENDFPLPEPVREAARILRGDAKLLARIAAIARRCRENHEVLLHADPQPGNILLTKTGPKLLDAEIAHIGNPAFDPGNLLGHLALAGIARADDTLLRLRARALWDAYSAAQPADQVPAFDEVAGLAAIEMLRRTIGAARVAATSEVPASLTAIDTARGWLDHPPASPEALEIT